MTKDELITAIRTAFKSVTLDNGIGLWEAHGIDFYYGFSNMMLELKLKDERVNWDKIPYKDLAECSSSLSFFDAKGMRFCLPKFLLFDLLSKELYAEEGITSPDVLFTLTYEVNGEFNQKIFSLFDRPQIQCIIDFLEYKLAEIEVQREEALTNEDYVKLFYVENDCTQLRETINEWKQKVLSL
jgi:hypothetical protein